MAAKIVEIKDCMNKSLRDSSKPWTFVLDIAESRTGVDRLYLFIAIIGFLTLWLIFGYAAQLVCNAIGFLYPAYASIHAIESHGKDDDTKWLTYWVAFAVFSIIEYFADYIVGWFPLYWLTKCTILVWMMIPTELNGSLLIYRKFIRPTFVQHHNVVDEVINKAAKVLDKRE